MDERLRRLKDIVKKSKFTERDAEEITKKINHNKKT